MLLAGDFAKTEAQATLLQKRINSIKNDALKGGIMLGAGVGMLSLFKAPLEEAKKFQTETAKFASLGFGDKVTSQAVKFATGMQTVGSSARDNLTLLSDAMAVFKNLEHAEFAAPIMAKMKFANEAVFGQKGGEHSTKFMDMLKVIEFRGGLSSEKEFATQANFVQQVISGSRNRVDATQLLQALKTGGVGLSQRSNKDFYLGAEPLIQEFGGQRYGTGAMSIYQNLVQSRGTITAQQELYRLGLLDKDKVSFNNLGMLKKAMPGSFVGSGVLEKEGELALLEKVLLPAFAAKGITSDEGIIREIGMIVGNRTGSSLLSRIYQQRATIKTQSAANMNAENIDQLSARAGGTMQGKQIDLHAKFQTLMLSLGTAVLPLAIGALEKLIPMVKGLTNWVDNNRGAVKLLSGAFIALAGGLMIRGSILLLGAALRGLGLSLAMGAVGGLSGMISGIGTAAGLIASPIGIAVLAIGTIAAACYAFRGITQGEVDAVKTDGGVKLTAGAAARIAAGEGGFVRPGANNKPIQVHTQVNMDGFKVANIVTQHQSKAASKPQMGTGRFDTSMMPLSPGMNIR